MQEELLKQIMMLSIFAKTDLFDTLNAFIANEDRLHELVELKDIEELPQYTSGWCLIVADEKITFPLDWKNDLPPYLLPTSIALSKAHFLGSIFGKLGNLEKAAQYLGEKHPLLVDFTVIYALQHELLIKQEHLEQDTQIKTSAAETYRKIHNQAICMNYAMLEKVATFEQLCTHYEKASSLAPDIAHRAFTIRHFASLLIDSYHLAQAQTIIEDCLKQKPAEQAEMILKSLLVEIIMQQLSVPYNWQHVSQAKGLIWETMQYFEKNQQVYEVATRLIDASEIANIQESYTESLGYINRAIAIFKEEALSEFEGNAHIRKATLLHTWAQNGNPQFYRPALSAYQDALKIFSKEIQPALFAEIQHRLGIVYSEMPDEPQKQQIWAAMSVKSFHEALLFFTKGTYPYEYAMICNNYANALSKFPTGLRMDNYPKAIELYEEALQIRSKDLPYERAITLLNYLEAQWFMTQDEAQNTLAQKLKIWEDMQQKAQEVLTLVEDTTLRKEANIHLEKLEKLKEVLLAE